MGADVLANAIGSMDAEDALFVSSLDPARAFASPSSNRYPSARQFHLEHVACEEAADCFERWIRAPRWTPSTP